MLTVSRYRPDDGSAWNRLVAQAKNATFLFDRSYMDYHADRFADHSLLFFRDGELLAALPASEHGEEIRSHGGLTYGGVICDHRMSVRLMLDVFAELSRYYGTAGFRSLRYKPVPHIYHIAPAEEDLYALFRCGASLVARGPSAAIDMSACAMPGKKQNGARRGQRLGLNVRPVDDATALMQAIDANLRLRHGVPAVHSPAEMNRLVRACRGKIELFQLEDATAALLGGAVVYVTPRVAHLQYLLVNDAGRPLRGMDVLVSFLAERYRERCRYLDFGISTESDGWILNEGLMRQKEEFGAGAINYDAFVLPLDTRQRQVPSGA